MTQNSDSYSRRGVSSQKEDVHAAISKVDPGLFPQAFCKILPDPFLNDPDACFVMHADGAGTKSSLAYLYWRETGDLSVWKGIAQDAIVMNTDDLMCVGVTGNMILSSTIGRNKHLIPGEVIAAIINGTEEILEELRTQGIGITGAGGETADVGDLVRTIIVDSTLCARIRRQEVIDNSRIKPGNVIVGFASSGQAKYETQWNSGIGSNGLTGARHDLLHKDYLQAFPESADSHTPKELLYCGPYHLSDTAEEIPVNIGKAILSPTRTYLPLVKAMLSEYRNRIAGMVHCSGGGQTKCLHFVKDLKIIKDNLPPAPFIFRAIQKHSGMPMKDMFRTYNMGVRLEVYTDEATAGAFIKLGAEFGISAQIIGRCEESTGKSLEIASEGQIIRYGS